MALHINQARNAWYPFARTYKWDIYFPEYGNLPFPASMASDTWMQITNGKVDYIPGGYSYPENATRGDLNITIFEIREHKMRVWLERWLSEISSDGMTISLLAKVAREVILSPLNLDNSPVMDVTLVVIPDGTLAYEYSSDKNSIVSASLQLLVVGR